MDKWTGIVSLFVTALITIITNFCVATWYASKYIERVERLTAEVNRYQAKVEKQEQLIQDQKVDFLKQQLETYKELASYGKMIAAMTGKANGVSFRQGEHQHE